MRRHLRPPMRDRLPNTPEGFEMPTITGEEAARKALLEDLREELGIARERLRTLPLRDLSAWRVSVVAVLEDRVRALEVEGG